MVVGLIATAEATSVVRLSSAAKRLREIGATEGADELERDAKIAAPWCQKCGRKIDDPVVGILGDRVAFACPWCSSPEVLAAWEQEGGAS
jgi:hypothetical protein